MVAGLVFFLHYKIMKHRYYIKVKYPAEATFSLVWELDPMTHSALLERVFAAFNHGSGQECDVFIGGKVRSLSVNDFVAVGDCWYKCESMGWLPISGAEVNRIESMTLDHPDFVHGAWFALNKVMQIENESLTRAI
jgi:hypothetical protein